MLFFKKNFIYIIFFITIYILYIFKDKIRDRREVYEPIIIEPIVIPSIVKEESNIEILNRLKEATRETFENSTIYDKRVADEVLTILQHTIQSKKFKNNIVKDIHKKVEKKKVSIKKRIKVIRKVKLKNRKNIVNKKKLKKITKITQKIELKVENKPKVVTSKHRKEDIEEENIKLEDLPLVETLGIVSVSKPFTINQ